MSEPYFVRDHRHAVKRYIATRASEEAMALSVGGGSFEGIGESELRLLIEQGLAEGRSLIDIGCGSGRLAVQVSKRFGDTVSYLGTDVVPEVLAYAKSRAPRGYRFELIAECAIPAGDESADFVTAFSVFTHLRPPDVARYLVEARRVLRSQGRLVFSYLELPRHAKIWIYTLLVTLLRRRKIENHFTSRRAIDSWAKELGFIVETIVPEFLGQSVAVLQKR